MIKFKLCKENIFDVLKVKKDFEEFGLYVDGCFLRRFDLYLLLVEYGSLDGYNFGEKVRLTLGEKRKI